MKDLHMPAYTSSSQRNALICAGTQGLGLAVARALAEAGHKLFLTARNEERLDEVAKHLAETHGIEVHLTPCDFASAKQRTALIESIREVWPNGPDILIHNTGGPPPTTALETEYTQWTNGFNALFLSQTQLNQAFVPAMMERGWGRVLSITSVAALEPVANLAISNSLRAAVTAYNKTLASEVAASGVTVNCLAPGYIGTDRLKQLFHYRAGLSEITPAQAQRQVEQSIPAGRLGRPEEFAHAARFLCSEEASYITGQTLCVDGGLKKSHG